MRLEPIYETHNNTYGGIIFSSDFCTERSHGLGMAARIASDWKFDEQCKRNSKFREKKVK